MKLLKGHSQIHAPVFGLPNKKGYYMKQLLLFLMFAAPLYAGGTEQKEKQETTAHEQNQWQAITQEKNKKKEQLKPYPDVPKYIICLASLSRFCLLALWGSLLVYGSISFFTQESLF